MNLEPISQVIISSDFTYALNRIKEILPQNARIENFIKDDTNFKVEDANEVIAKAYLASQEKVFLILGSKAFSDVVQNRLLKIIEEPPKNKEFILITNSKATLLPTIKSRLPIVSLDIEDEKIELTLDLKKLTLEEVYKFIQEHKRLKPKEAIDILEQIVIEAIKSQDYNLDQKSLKIFLDARVALEHGSPADFVLTITLLTLLEKKRGKKV